MKVKKENAKENVSTYVPKKTNRGLIAIMIERIIGEVADLNHALPYSPSKININVGTYSDCKDARIVVIAAGANQAPGETNAKENVSTYVPKKTNRGLIAIMIVCATLMTLLTIILPIVFAIMVLFVAG